MSDRGSNFKAPKKDSFNLSISIGIIFLPIVLSCISEYGNFSTINTLLTMCLSSEFLDKNSATLELFLVSNNFLYSFFTSLAIASGCSNSDPPSSNLSANLGSSLFLEINQKFCVFCFFSKFIFKIFEYFFSIILIKSLIVLLVGIVKYLSSSELIWLTNGLVISLYGSIIIETTYSIHSSHAFSSNQRYIWLKGYSSSKSKLLSIKWINFFMSFNRFLIFICWYSLSVFQLVMFVKDFLRQSINKTLSFFLTIFISLIFFKAISLLITQLFNKVGWFTINGAIPNPVEFPIPKFLQIFLSNTTALLGFLWWATWFTWSNVNCLTK